MLIGIVQAEISIPEARSLKDKRMVIRSLKDRALNKMNVSIAEVGEQDVWTRSHMAVVTVAATRDIVQKRISDIERYLQSDPRFVLMQLQTEIL